jgi:methylated-DNA-[protein]-cysteine S-methyltransferase
MCDRCLAMPIEYALIESPLGELLALGEDGALCGLHMLEGRRPVALRSAWRRADDRFGDARAQLEEYFAGERTSFDLELRMDGTDFQRLVWRGLRDIPYGETISYGELADRIGCPGAARAVGLANGQNPIAVIVPCHRVIGANGTLTGYGGGLERKRLLLDLEAGVASLPVR